MAVVTGVARRKNRVRIDLDRRFFMDMRLKDYERFPLSEGDVIDEREFEDQLSSVQFSDGYEEALTLLDYSQRTAEEIRKKLISKGFAAPAAEAVVQRLAEVRLLDDAAYAKQIVGSISHKPVGVYAAKRKLRAKGFSEDDAEEALEQLDDEQQAVMALNLARKLLPRYEGKGDPRAVKAKLSQALARRGFAWEHVKSAVDSLLDEELDED